MAEIITSWSKTTTEVLPRLLNVDEVAKALTLSKSATYRLIASGAIQTTRIGRAIRVSVAQLNTFLDNSVEN